MKEKSLIIMICLFLVSSICIMFVYGNKVVNEDVAYGYTTIKFKILETNIDKKDSSPLEYTISNLENEKQTFNIIVLLDGVVAEEFSQKILGRAEKTFSPSEKMIKQLFSTPFQKTAKYSVEIKWDKNSETISKTLTLKTNDN